MFSDLRRPHGLFEWPRLVCLAFSSEASVGCCFLDLSFVLKACGCTILKNTCERFVPVVLMKKVPRSRIGILHFTNPVRTIGFSI